MSSDSRLLILGAGGHGRVVADAARRSGRWQRIAFLDNNRPLHTELDGSAVVGRLPDIEHLRAEYSDVLVAFGDNHLRMNLLNTAAALGFRLPVLVHTHAFVSNNADLGPGTVVLPFAAVNAGAVIGRGVIVNTGAVVEHDCHLGDGAHVSPGAIIGGRVSIGDLTWIGIGAAVRDEIEIGAGVIVGAGSVVVKHLPDGALVYGEAARIRNQPGAKPR